jgi:hypothetical protein
LEELKDNGSWDSDLDKALQYTKPVDGKQTYQYQYGLALCFLPELKCFWFQNGVLLE